MQENMKDSEVIMNRFLKGEIVHINAMDYWWTRAITAEAKTKELELLLTEQFALVSQIGEEKNTFKIALQKIAFEEYGRPAEMMLIARKALKGSYRGNEREEKGERK